MKCFIEDRPEAVRTYKKDSMDIYKPNKLNILNSCILQDDPHAKLMVLEGLIFHQGICCIKCYRNSLEHLPYWCILPKLLEFNLVVIIIFLKHQ